MSLAMRDGGRGTMAAAMNVAACAPARALRFPCPPQDTSGGTGPRRVGPASFSVAAGVLLLLAACTLPETEAVREEAAKTQALIEAQRPDPGPARYRALRVVEGRPYTGLAPIEPAPARLPDRLQGEAAISVPVTGRLTPATVAARLQVASGLALRLTGTARPAETDGAEPEADVFRADSLVAEGGVWTGPLDRFLDRWTEALGWAWRYDGASETVEVLRRRSVVFRVHALAGRQTQRATASSAGSVSGSGAGATSTARQEILTEVEYDPWPALEEQLATLVGEETRLGADPNSASVIVDGLPGDVARVRAYLDYLNREVLRPVTLSLRLYRVARSRGADYALDVAATLERLAGESLDLVLQQAGAGYALRLASPGSGSGREVVDAAVRALSTSGTVSQVLSTSITALNGRAAHFQELFTQNYLAEVKQSFDEGRVSTELTPGTVSSGAVFSYAPRITGPDEVLLRLFASLVDPPEIEQFSSAEATIQLPRYGNRAVSVDQRVRRGEALVITGFRDRAGDADAEGFFNAFNFLPRGAQTAELTEAELVLLLTAEIGAPLGISEVPGIDLGSDLESAPGNAP